MDVCGSCMGRTFLDIGLVYHITRNSIVLRGRMIWGIFYVFLSVK